MPLIYLLKHREAYKIGVAETRPKGSLYCLWTWIDNEAVSVYFGNTFQTHPEYGNQYYSGELHEIKRVMQIFNGDNPLCDFIYEVNSYSSNNVSFENGELKFKRTGKALKLFMSLKLHLRWSGLSIRYLLHMNGPAHKRSVNSRVEFLLLEYLLAAVASAPRTGKPKTISENLLEKKKYAAEVCKMYPKLSRQVIPEQFHYLLPFLQKG